jgi:hypothetical protein
LGITNDDLEMSLEESFSLEDALDSGSSDALQLTFTLGDNVDAGTYRLDLRTYYDYDELSDIYLFDLEVGECEVEEIVVEEEEEETSSESATEITVTDNESEESDSSEESSEVVVDSDSETVNTVEKSYLKDEYFLALIIVAGMLFLALLFVLIMLLARK